jgi:hypothetical protein
VLTIGEHTPLLQAFLEERRFMNWKTVYIVGREGFNDEVMRHLERSGLDFMSGYHARETKEAHELFWIPETMSTREFKEGIGAKTVFKYRLRFFDSLEQFVETLNSNEFTDDEKRKVERMRLIDSAA